MNKTGKYKTTIVRSFEIERGEGKYDDIALALNEANLYDSVIVPLPEGMDSRTAMNRIGMGIMRFFVKIPRGTCLMKRTICWESERAIQVIVMPQGAK